LEREEGGRERAEKFFLGRGRKKKKKKETGKRVLTYLVGIWSAGTKGKERGESGPVSL